MTRVEYCDLFFCHEIPFCRVYSLESKDKLEKLFLNNRISFFIEWKEKSLWDRFFGNEVKEKNIFTIRINEADSVLAKGLIEGMESVQLA